MTDELRIKNIVGEQLLSKIQDSYLKYLESAAAVNEVDGGFAIAKLSSKYCKFLNQASRKMAGKTDEEALKSGEWICHEDCWGTSLRAIKDKKSCETRCSGGIKVFAAPIIAEGRVIGANRAAVSNPPTDEQKINEIAERYKVDPKDLLKIARKYSPRPDYLFSAAKNHILVAAETIASLFLHKSKEAALRQSEQKYQTIVETANEGMWVADNQRRTTFVNKQMAEMLGYAPDEMLGLKIDAFIPKEDLEDHLARMGLRKQGEGSVYERRLLHKDGTIIHALVSGTVFKEPTGSILGTFAMITDITERKKAEMESWLNSAIEENLSEGIYLIGADDLIIKWANHKLENMFGYGPGEMVGKHVSVVNAPTDKDPVETANEITDNLNKRGEWHGEVQNIKKDGTVFWCHANCSVADHPVHGRVLISVHTDIARHKQAEELLRKEKEFNEKLIEIAQVVILVLDVKGCIISFNPYMEKISGYRLEEVRGKDWFQTFLPKEDHERIREVFLQSVSDIHTKGNINPIIARDGRKIEVEWYDNTIKAADGSILGVLAIGQDITDRKNAEKELRESEEKYRKIFENANDAILFHDITAGILDANILACQRYGYTRQELLKMNVQQIDTVDQSKHIPERIASITQTGYASFETVHVAKEGKLIPTDVRSCLIVLNGEPAIMSICRDITERKQAEQKILEDSEFLSVVLNSMSDNICVIDVIDNSIVDCNESFLNHYGFEKNDVIGRKCYEITHNQDRPCNASECDCPVQETLESGKCAISEHIHQHKTKENVLEITTAPIRNADGEIIQIIHIAKDITARKTAEKALMESEKMAAVGRLSTGIAHELNNPLMGIGGYLSILQDKLNDKDNRDLAAKALKETKRCTKIIKDLLVFSRSPEESLEEIDLVTIIRTLGSRHEDNYKENGISVKLSIEDDAISIKGNETNIETVLDNIIRNAIDAMAESSKKILEIRVFRSDEDAVIEISDSGIGIPHDIIDKVTEPFFTTKKPLQGTGLGLAICSSIINDYGGRFCIDSIEGEGTKITVALPLLREAVLIGG